MDHLRTAGAGMDLPGVKGSLWAVFNAVLEYVDHYERIGLPGVSTTLFGPGAALKRRAFDLAVKELG